MKKLTILIAIATTFLVATGCQQQTPPPLDTYSEDEEVMSEATIQPRMEGTAVSIDCDSNGLWTCSSDYGGSIDTVEYLVGMVSVAEYFSAFGTVDKQIEIYTMEHGDNVKMVEKIEVDGNQGAILENSANGKTYWFTIQNLEGKEDYGVRCRATIDSEKFETYKASIEEMCTSLRVSE